MYKIEVEDTLLDRLKEKHWLWFKNHLTKTFSKKPQKTYGAFIKKYFGWDETALEKIIKGSKSKLEKIIKDVQAKNIACESLHIFRNDPCKSAKQKQNKFHKKVMEAFGYDNFIDQKKSWDAYELCEALKIDVCPYCNRQYIFTVDNQSGMVRPELDHYFPKQKYPYLSACFFNLIPSCSVCNHLKSSQDDRVVYPYENEFGKHGMFRLKSRRWDRDIITISELVRMPGVYIKIDNLRTSLGKQINNSKKVFNLDALYNMQSIELNDLISRYQNFTGANKVGLKRMFKGVDVERLILGIPLNPQKRYIMQKFKEDIIKHLNSLKRW